MQRIKTILAILALAGAFSLSAASVAGSAEPAQHKISGVVLDKENKPLGNIWVRIYRGVKEVGSSNVTGQDGKYEVEFVRGSPITTVRYDSLTRSKLWHPAIVTDISGSKDHEIGKVMHATAGSGYSQLEFLEMLSAYERLHVIDQAADLSGIRADIRARYVTSIGMMKVVHPIEGLRQVTHKRHGLLSELYGQKP